jgi:adenylylsulfate kinase-like enzyme
MNLEDPFSAEKEPRVHTREEVLNFISNYVENPVVVRELSDEKGLYLLEVKIEGKEPGEIIEYEYMRKGRVLNKSVALETAMHINYYQGDMPISGEKIAVYNEDSGEWEKRAK